MSDLEFEFVTYTPAKVEELVALHGISRKKFSHRENDAIVHFAAKMRAWEWRFNGDAIIFDRNGKLINGRKRLLACLDANAEFVTLVIRGVDPAAKSRIDQHKRRTESDNTGVAGFQDHANLSAAVSSILDISKFGLPSQKGFIHGSVVKILREDKNIIPLFDRLKDSSLTPYFPLSDLVALVYLTGHVSDDESTAFFNALGAEIAEPSAPADSPLAVLAQGLIENRKQIDNGGSMGSSATRYKVVSFVTKAWNAVRTNTSLSPLSRQKKVHKSDRVMLHGLPEGMFAEYFLDTRDTSNPPPRYDESVVRKIERSTTVAVETIMPEEAMRILATLNGPLSTAPRTEEEQLFGGSDKRGKNRNISQSVVRSYARDMKAQEWMITGESVKFSRSGRLIDGQHRLKACAESGIPLVTVVVRGLEEDVFDTFDTAINHTYARMLALGGITHSKILENTLTQLWIYREFGLGAKSSEKPRPADLDSIREEWEGIEEHVAFAADPDFRKFALPPEYMAVSMAIAERDDPALVADYFGCLPRGANLKKGTVRHTVRLTLLNTASDVSTRNPWPHVGFLLRGWEAYRLSDEANFKAPSASKFKDTTLPDRFMVAYAPTIDRTKIKKVTIDDRQQSFGFDQ